MDTPGTLALAIHCASCNATFRSRVKNPAPRSSWRQRSALNSEGQRVTAYLCDRCSARFSTEEAALDYLGAALEQNLREQAKRPPLPAS